MSPGYRPLRTPSPPGNNTNTPLLTREATTSPGTAATPKKDPLPTLSDGATIAIILAIVLAAAAIVLLAWCHRRRSRRRAAAKANSGATKWDPSPPPSSAPSPRSWVDVDVEVAAGRRAARDEGSARGYRGRVWGGPKWDAVAERMARNEWSERARSERGGTREVVGGPGAKLFHLPGPPPAVARRPAGDGGQVPSKDEPRVAMLWAPGQRAPIP